MPYKDGTGPAGNGPMGWGRGPCGRGMRGGGGYGRGYAARPCAPVSEREVLENETQALKARLTELEKRLGQISGESK